MVTTTRITHATPAATYAHTVDRDWEADADLPAEARAAGCKDIARQMVENPEGARLDVILGGGRRMFLPATTADPEYADKRGSRTDRRDRIEEWRRRTRGRYVWNAEQFASLDPERDRRVLGLFEPDHMRYEADRRGEGGRALARRDDADGDQYSALRSGRVRAHGGGRPHRPCAP